MADPRSSGSSSSNYNPAFSGSSSMVGLVNTLSEDLTRVLFSPEAAALKKRQGGGEGVGVQTGGSGSGFYTNNNNQDPFNKQQLERQLDYGFSDSQNYLSQQTPQLQNNFGSDNSLQPGGGGDGSGGSFNSAAGGSSGSNSVVAAGVPPPDAHDPDLSRFSELNNIPIVTICWVTFFTLCFLIFLVLSLCSESSCTWCRFFKCCRPGPVHTRTAYYEKECLDAETGMILSRGYRNNAAVNSNLVAAMTSKALQATSSQVGGSCASMPGAVGPGSQPQAVATSNGEPVCNGMKMNEFYC